MHWNYHHKISKSKKKKNKQISFALARSLLKGLILGSSFRRGGCETLQNQKTGCRGLFPHPEKNLFNTEWIRESLHQDKRWPVCQAGKTMLKGEMLSSCVPLFFEVNFFPSGVGVICHVICQLRKKGPWIPKAQIGNLWPLSQYGPTLIFTNKLYWNIHAHSFTDSRV